MDVQFWMVIRMMAGYARVSTEPRIHHCVAQYPGLLHSACTARVRDSEFTHSARYGQNEREMVYQSDKRNLRAWNNPAIPRRFFLLPVMAGGT